ncbi:MAG: SGNH/GDSL hydrolase family protein [Elusimicrobia bacterium]|nr:SGNH/GDSL hydrolase family protein [Elusimicrobiota bacterium]
MRPVGKRLGLAAIGLALGLACGEALLRLVWHRPKRSPRYADHPVLGHTYPRGVEQTAPRHRRFNREGFQDWEHATDKPKGVVRILLLGDSFVAGTGVHFAETLPRALERRLRSASPGAPAFEVISMACDGYGTAQQYLALRHLGLRYRPDAIVLAFYWNDFNDNSVRLVANNLPRPFFVLDEHGNLFARPMWRPPRISFEEYSALWILDWTRYGYAILSSRRRYRPIAGQEEEYSKAKGLTAALLGEMSSIARRHRASFTIVGVPGRGQLDAGRNRLAADARRFLLDTSRALGAPLVDLEPVFRESMAREGLRVDDLFLAEPDTHWNARGHRLAAQAIAAGLERTPPRPPLGRGSLR